MKKVFLVYAIFNLTIPNTVSTLLWIKTGNVGNVFYYSFITILCFGFYKVIDVLEGIYKKL